MQLLKHLLEMAKSKKKRVREAKLARKKKASNPTPDAQSNIVAKHAQTSGAGAHEDKGGQNASRTRQKRQWRKEEGM